MVTVTTTLPVESHQEIAAVISRIVKQTSSLTPRPKGQIVKALRLGNIALVFADDKLVGWLMATSYSAKVQELGMAYIVPEYRNQGLLDRMIAALVANRPCTVAVTYEQRLADQLIGTWGFRYSSLGECNQRTGRKFTLTRIASLASLISVLRHMKKSQPIYLIRELVDEK